MVTPPSIPDRIPVNIITGFLGSGKTSAVLNLLKQKPRDEHWAILVNEFGEIGVDRSLMQGHAVTHDRVAIFEVPGGCMCCAAGLPMQMALSQLLFLGRPDRLLIEPTGLGHPVEVLQTLFSEAYLEMLEVQSTVTLIDARSAANERHANHASFVQQLRIADLILANKKDLYSDTELSLIEHLVQQHCDRDIAIYPPSRERSIWHSSPNRRRGYPQSANHTTPSPTTFWQRIASCLTAAILVRSIRLTVSKALA